MEAEDDYIEVPILLQKSQIQQPQIIDSCFGSEFAL